MILLINKQVLFICCSMQNVTHLLPFLRGTFGTIKQIFEKRMLNIVPIFHKHKYLTNIPNQTPGYNQF